MSALSRLLICCVLVLTPLSAATAIPTGSATVTGSPLTATIRPYLSETLVGEPIRVALHLRDPDFAKPPFPTMDAPRGILTVKKVRVTFSGQPALEMQQPLNREVIAEMQNLCGSLVKLSFANDGVRVGSQHLEDHHPAVPWQGTWPATATGRVEIAIEATATWLGRKKQDRASKLKLHLANFVCTPALATLPSATAAQTAVLAALPKGVASRPPQWSPARITADGQYGLSFSIPPESVGWTSTSFTAFLTPGGTVTCIDKRTVSHCLASGTSIATPSGPRAIETLAVGDAVHAYDHAAQRVVTTTLRATQSSVRSDCLSIDGLVITPEHPVRLSGAAGDDAWIPAGTVRVGQELDDGRGGSHRVQRIEPALGLHTVHDLSCDAPHCFIAAGILVHNKSPPHMPPPTTPTYDDPFVALFAGPDAAHRLWPTPAASATQAP